MQINVHQNHGIDPKCLSALDIDRGSPEYIIIYSQEKDTKPIPLSHMPLYLGTQVYTQGTLLVAEFS